MITVNDREIEWNEDITFQDIFKFLEYNISKPYVMTKVDGRTIEKHARDNFKIIDGSHIIVLNLLHGG